MRSGDGPDNREGGAAVGTICTARLELRPLGLDDVDALWPYVSDPELPRLMTWEAHRSPEETRAFVRIMESARAAGSAYAWTIRRDGALCGMVGLHEVVRTNLAWRLDRAELGYWCGAAHRNHGLVTEAADAVMRVGFESLGLHKIAVGCASENAASRRVIEKLGFRYVGEQRDHFFRDGRWWHHRMYELTHDEWRALPRLAAP